MIFLGKRPHREGGPGKIYIIDEANISIRRLLHEPSVQVGRVDDGFAWGYTGAGAQQLALALLLETTNDEELSESLYLLFLEEVIEKITVDCWALDAQEIKKWITDLAEQR